MQVEKGAIIGGLYWRNTLGSLSGADGSISEFDL